jgi:hypothetical protein
MQISQTHVISSNTVSLIRNPVSLRKVSRLLLNNSVYVLEQWLPATFIASRIKSNYSLS